MFFNNIRLDEESLRFYYACDRCGKRTYSGKLPLLCRGVRTLARCKTGTAGGWKQKAYNRAKHRVYSKLILQFNLCQRCFKFVCDGCFDTEADLCHDCSRKKAKKSSKNYFCIVPLSE